MGKHNAEKQPLEKRPAGKATLKAAIKNNPPPSNDTGSSGNSSGSGKT